MKYVMRLNVSHDGIDANKGEECPAKILKAMQQMGYVEEHEDAPEMKAEVMPVEEPKKNKSKKNEA